MKEFGKHIAVNLRDEALGGNQLIIRIPTVLTVDEAKQVIKDMNKALIHASPSFVKPGMTRGMAQLEAERRWGKEPYPQVFDRLNDNSATTADSLRGVASTAERVGRYWVGKGDHGPIHGNGKSWEEAFADADTREEKLFVLADKQSEEA